jgi:ankyrin repeat protein
VPAHESTPDLSHQRQLFLDHLFTCPYEDRKNINPERISGTCEWFTTHQLFRSWNENDQSALLWVSADPGSGKSVLARYLIDHVLPIPGITVCYFFFKDGFPDQQSVLHALRSLIHQICLQNMSLISSFILQTSKMSETSFFNSFDRLWNTLIGFARQRATGEIICVLDGLDECREEDLLQLSAKLRSFFLEPTGDKTRLKFLLTSRPYDYVRWELQELENLIPTIHLAGESEAEVEKISREIDIVVENRLRTIGIKRRLRDKERHHLLKLVMAVHNRTYLWICLTIDVIEKMHGFTRGNVIESLTTLPQTVDEAYENILRRCTDQKGAWKALHLILAATRPLSVSELSMAMILDDSDNSLSSIHKRAEPEERFAETLRNLCGLLVVIVQDKVYFLHQTAREFLVHPERKALSVSEDPSTLGPWKHSIQQVVGHSISARACIWYLVSDLWEGELEDFDPSTYQAYASQHWHYHLRKSDISSDDDIVHAALQLCRTHRFLVGMEGENPLSVAAYLGIQQVVQLLIKTSGPNADNQNDDCRTPLSWAAQEGNIELVEFLISQKSTVLDGRDPCSPDLTPLHHAAVQGHAEVLQRLLDTKKVDVNAWLQYKPPCRDLHFDEFKILRDFWSDTALCWAVRFGKSDVVRILLLDDNIDVESVNEYGETALMRAATQGDEKLVNIIAMSGKVNVNATDCRGLTVIERAAWRGQANVVRILLQTEKIDSESKNEALFTAVAHGKWSIVETFYSYTVFHSYGSIDANIADENGETVLMRAASQGDLTIVEILLRFPGIDINSIGQGTGDDWGPGRRGDTALINAARAGHERVVQYLIDAGADTRMRNVDGDNALSTAASYLHFGVLAAVLGSADWPDGETRRLLCRARLRLVHQPEEDDALESAGLSEADRIRAEGVIELLHRHSSGNQS